MTTKTLVKTIIVCLFCSVKIVAQTAKPFPQHYVYTAGSILPNNRTQAQLDSITIAFYNQWKGVYLKNNCATNEYYVWFQPPAGDNTLCVSEGQGYGMLIAAYMAGYDPNAQTYFDGLYNYYNAHKSTINPTLMAWQQITGCGNNPSGGGDAATDGDLDIAYALLLAHNQWGSTGTINYLQKANALITAIMQDEINPITFTTKLGDWANSTDPMYYDTRCSDFMMDHFRAFHAASNNANWANVTNKCYTLINTMQATKSPNTGLLPDFIVNCNTTPTPASANYLESAYDGHYYYNSCRTPWRISTDYLLNGDVRAKTALDKMNTWIRVKTSNNAATIKDGYHLSGTGITGSTSLSSAFVAPFAVAAMDSSINQAWLNNSYNTLIGLQLANEGYFENTIKMMALIVLSGNWWAVPSIVTAVPFPHSTIGVTVAPNPNKGTFTVHSTTENLGKTIEVYTILGNRINSYILTSNALVLNNLLQGIYILKLQGGAAITKIVVE